MAISAKSVAMKLAALTYLSGILAVIGFITYLSIIHWKVSAMLLSVSAASIMIVMGILKPNSNENPLTFVANRLFLAAYNFLIYRRRFIWEQLYDVLCLLIPNTEWKHMNWGYASLTPNGIFVNNLTGQDETERYSIQLYHYMATGMGLYKDLKDKTLVEVSSGRGGGLDYIARKLDAKKCIGVDISQVQIDYCREIYAKNHKLVFLNGESEKLSKLKELGEEEVDIIINVESGHCYSNFKKFIEEVDRVLKPGGIFAYSDFRPVHEWEQTHKELTSFSLEVTKMENISENVMHSLKLDEKRKWELIERKIGPVLRFFFKQIGGVKGSHIYEGLSKGSMRSMAYVLTKPQTAN